MNQDLLSNGLSINDLGSSLGEMAPFWAQEGQIIMSP
jgi:hypothetical protein